MTNSQMFMLAHAEAKASIKYFGGSYRTAFASALRGYQAVKRGYRGVEIIGENRWY